MFTRLDGGVNARLEMLSVLPASSERALTKEADNPAVRQSCGAPHTIIVEYGEQNFDTSVNAGLP